jgi:pimeloyl-ACP methyl ester carboxylesterase
VPILTLQSTNCNYLQLQPESVASNPLPEMVMVHGLAANLAFWYNLGTIFSATHRVTLWDLRGHGRSSMPLAGYQPAQMAQDLKELMDLLEIERATLVAHSFGGEVALHFGSCHPDRVHQLILADVRLKLCQPQQKTQDWPQWPQLQPKLNALGIQIDPEEPEAGYKLLTELAKLQINSMPDQGQLPADLVPFSGKRMAQQWLKLIQTTQALDELIGGQSISQAQCQQLDKPTLLMYGDRSPTLPTAQGLQSLWPHAQLKIIPEAGHFFPLSQPGLFAQLTHDWLFPGNSK